MLIERLINVGYKEFNHALILSQPSLSCYTYKAMKKLPKLLFFDFDNTLIDSRTHQIPPSTSDALHRLVEKGYHIAIASGRNYPNLKATGACDAYAWSGFCLNNGQLVLDAHQKTIHHHFLPHEGILEAIRIAQEEGLNAFFSSPDGDFLMEAVNDLVLQAHNFFQEPIPEVHSYQGQPIDKILIYAPLGYSYARFKAIPGLATYVSVSTYADLASAGISKYSSIVELCKHLKLPVEFSAFGDSQNDIEMLQGASVGVAMGNGDPKLKAIADYVALPIDQDGLANILVDLGYLN